MHNDPIYLLQPVFHFVDWMIQANGDYLYLACFYASIPCMAWVLSGGLRHKPCRHNPAVTIPIIRVRPRVQPPPLAAIMRETRNAGRGHPTTMMAETGLRLEVEGARTANPDAGSVQVSLAVRAKGSRLLAMNAPIDIELIKGRQRAEDMRRLAAGEITPEELQRENSFIRSPGDIVHTDFSPKGTPEEWARIISIIEQS